MYDLAIEWRDNRDAFFCTYSIYDLGGLGFGIKGLEVKDDNFVLNHFYNAINTPNGNVYKSTGLHKPAIIRHALETNAGENICYTDIDTELMQYIEIDFNRFDIAVVEREHEDRQAVCVGLRGNYNAGVLFFRNCPEVLSFLRAWQSNIDSTLAEGRNDQKALSEELEKSDLKILVLPSVYNSSKRDKHTIIYHQTGGKKLVDGQLKKYRR
jgi:hypothetical protein